MSVQAAASVQQATTVVREVTVHCYHEFGSVRIREWSDGTFEEGEMMWTQLSPRSGGGMGNKYTWKKMDASEARKTIQDVAINGPTSPFDTRNVNKFPTHGGGL